MRLLKGICAVTAAVLVASSAYAQDRPDLLDVHLGEFETDTNGMTVVQVLNDNGKGKPITGANNRIGNAFVDSTEAFVVNTLAGTVPATANGGNRVELAWGNNEFDKVQRSSKSATVDQKAELAWGARIVVVTTMGATTTATTGGTAMNDLEWQTPFTDGMGNGVAGGVDDCSAKFQAKGTADPVSGVPVQDDGQPDPPPTSAKWQAKCKQTTYGALLTAIGVPAANATTILQGLGVAATDKVKIQGKL